MAATMASTTICSDVLLPADSDTVEIAVPDSQGKMATFEALPPGTRMRARLDRNPSRAETCVTFKPQEDSIVAHPVCAQFVPDSGAHGAVGTLSLSWQPFTRITETKA